MARLGRSQPFLPTINRLIIIESATSYVLTGVSGAGSVGSVGIGIGIGLTQVLATGLVGTLAVSIGATLTGVSATGIPGTVSYAELFPGGGGLVSRVIGSSIIRRMN